MGRYWLFYTSITAFGIVFFRNSLAEGVRIYNTLPFYPVALAIFLRAMSDSGPSPRRASLVAWLCLLSVVAVPLGFVRVALLFPFYWKSGMTLAEARHVFHDWQGKEPGRVGVTAALWLLTEDYHGISCDDRLRGVDRAGHRIGLVVLQQYHAAQITQVKGFRLVHSYRVEEVPTLLGIPLARSMPGYQFAVYVVSERSVKSPLRKSR